MPGQKDFVSVKKDGKRQAIQKRLLMMTLREAYKHFKTNNDQVDIGFFSFARLRPKQCKLLPIQFRNSQCLCVHSA